jgi:dihydroorotate dehydrogenase electron transfer subunit
MHKDPQARITRRQSWEAYHRLDLHSPRIAAEAAPGQFLMIRVAETFHPLLRRPFSIHAVSGSELSVFFQSVGAGTRLLSRADVGQGLDILGPLGRGFDLNRDLRGRRIGLVGGGRGIAPLYFLADRLRKKQAEIRVYYGGRTLQDLVLKTEFQAAGFDPVCSTDDGSHGYHGMVTGLLHADRKTYAPELLYACGPHAMLHTVGKMSQDFGIPAELSLESIMGCGFGACWGCVHKIRRQGDAAWTKICEQGPVFPAEDVVWEEEDGGR